MDCPECGGSRTNGYVLQINYESWNCNDCGHNWSMPFGKDVMLLDDLKEDRPEPNRKKVEYWYKEVTIHTSPRGGRYVKSDELLRSPQVRRTVEEMKA